MKKEYSIDDNWVGYELHPETPPAGILLSDRFKRYDLAGFYDQLRGMGKEIGIVFGKHTLLSNSKLALQASEYARDLGKYAEFHENIFYAYFTECLDIGNLEVIAAVAGKSGLDEAQMISAVKDGRYAQRLISARIEGQQIKLTGVPTFIIEGKHQVVGAQPLEVFRNLLDKVKGKKS